MPLQRTCRNPACQRTFLVPPSLVAYGRGLYCCAACRWAIGAWSKPSAVRFWAKVRVCPHGRDCVFCCFPWQGYVKGRSTTPFFAWRMDGHWQTRPAGVYAWMLLNGQPFPPGRRVRHICQNSLCVNGMHVMPARLPPQVLALLRQKIAAGRLRLPGWEQHSRT